MNVGDLVKYKQPIEDGISPIGIVIDKERADIIGTLVLWNVYAHARNTWHVKESWIEVISI